MAWLFVPSENSDEKLQNNTYFCPDCGSMFLDQWECAVEENCPNCGTRHLVPWKSQNVDNSTAPESTDAKIICNPETGLAEQIVLTAKYPGEDETIIAILSDNKSVKNAEPLPPSLKNLEGKNAEKALQKIKKALQYATIH